MMEATHVDGTPLLIQIDDVFTTKQCQDMIAAAELTGFTAVDRGDMAQYGRVVMILPDLARVLYNRLKHIIPSTVDGNPTTGLNDHFRFSKYHPGQRFNIHKDGINQDSNGDRSALTLNIFLNDTFEGGETEFYHTSPFHGETVTDSVQRRFVCQPQAGRGALFFAQQYHCGKEVTDGIKYLIRTDVMVTDRHNVRHE